MDAPSTSSPDTPEHRSGVMQDARSLARELHGMFHAQVCLAALETRRAGESLVWMITLGAIVGTLLVSAWLGLLAVIALTLIERGVMTSPSAVLLVAVGANLLLALILGWTIHRKRLHLQFPATVRSLTPDAQESS